MNSQQAPIDIAKDTLVQEINNSGVPVKEFVRLGQLAEQVIVNRSMYPQLMNRLIMSGMMEPEEASGEMDYQLLISLIALGRVGREMSQGDMGVV